MSLMDMNRAAKKHGRWIAGTMILFMVGGVVYTGLGRNTGGGPQQMEPGGSSEPPIAKIAGLPIVKSALDRQMDQMYQGQLPPPAEDRDEERLRLIDQQKIQQAVVVAAEKNGVKITDADVDAEREKLWNTEGRAAYAGKLGLKPDAPDAEIDAALAKLIQGGNPMTVAAIKASLPADLIRVRIAQERLKDSLSKTIAVDPATVKRSFNEIKVSHILIKSGEGALPDGQAKAKAEKVLAEVKGDPANIAKLAKTYSDDPGSKDKGGLYDWQAANTYVGPFSKGAFEAGKGKVNPKLVKTTFGYHIIALLDERPGKNAPKDLETNTAKYVEEYKTREVGPKVQEAVDAVKDQVSVELVDPGLKAAQLVRDGMKAAGAARDAKLAEALTELAKIDKKSDPEGAAPIRRGKIYDSMGKKKEAVGAYEEAIAARNYPETRLLAAQDYLDLGDKDKARAQLSEAEKLPIPSPALLMTMGTLYSKLGDKAKEKAILAKSQEMMKVQQQQMMEQIQAQMKQQGQSLPPPAPASKGEKSAAPPAPKKK